MKLSDYVFHVVAAAGVRHVFMVPGGAAMHLNDSLGTSTQLSYVATFHEHAASVAAEAYAKLTNHPGVAMVTAGPGSTNAITGVASAWVNSAPLVVVSGQVKRADMNPGTLRQSGLQEVDIVSIVRPITKYAVTLTDPATARYHVEKALYLAQSGRPGPVWICVPLDVQAAMIDPDSQRGFTPESRPAAPDLERHVDAVVEMLRRSERPLVLIGYGVRVAGAEHEALELVERLAAPVQTTWIGCDLVAFDHPLFAGRPGSFASRGANFAIQNCDFLLALGARFDFATTGYSRERFARAARRVAVDVDDAEVRKLQHVVELGIVASAKDVLQIMLRKTERLARRDRSAWMATIRNWHAKYPIVTESLRGIKSGTSAYVLTERLSELLCSTDIIVEGSSGVHSEIFFMSFNVKKGQRVLADGSYGAMGYGIPAAIGACVGGGRRRTILVEGDGSLQPNLQELQTIVREQLPIKIIVVNNGGYASIRFSQQRYFGRLVAADASSGLTLPDLSRIAGAYGLRYVRIGCESELDQGLRNALEGGDPVICDVVVPGDEDRVPKLSNVQRPDGSMVSKPLEDLFPFLDRAEFRRNMIVDPLPEE